MTSDFRAHARGGARGQNLDFFLVVVVLKNGILFLFFASRTEDLTLNVRDQVLD